MFISDWVESKSKIIIILIFLGISSLFGDVKPAVAGNGGNQNPSSTSDSGSCLSNASPKAVPESTKLWFSISI